MITKRNPSPFDLAVVAIACLLMLLIVPLTIALAWFLAVAIPGQ